MPTTQVTVSPGPYLSDNTPGWIRSALATPKLISAFIPLGAANVVPDRPGRFKILDGVADNNAVFRCEDDDAASHRITSDYIPGVTALENVDGSNEFGVILQGRGTGSPNPVSVEIGEEYSSFSFMGIFKQESDALGRIGGVGNSAEPSGTQGFWWGVRGSGQGFYVAYSDTSADWLINSNVSAGTAHFFCVTFDYLTGLITCMIDTTDPSHATHSTSLTADPADFPQILDTFAILRRPKLASGTGVRAAHGPGFFFGANLSDPLWVAVRESIGSNMMAAAGITPAA